MLLQHAVVGIAGTSLRAATEAGVAAAKSGRASMEKVATRENILRDCKSYVEELFAEV